jgi:hypothetical protein
LARAILGAAMVMAPSARKNSPKPRSTNK